MGGNWLLLLNFKFIISCGRFELVGANPNWHLRVKRLLFSCKESQVILIVRIHRLSRHLAYSWSDSCQWVLHRSSKVAHSESILLIHLGQIRN